MDIISKEIISINGIDKVKIVGIKTGRLAIKESALNSKKPGFISTLLSFKDKEFGQWLPIWTWLIVHTEGTFLVDTGLSSDVNQNGYFKRIDLVAKYYFEKQMKFDIRREEEIDYQLNKLGIEPDSISQIILTHLHIDHVGGLKYFPNTPILINEKEWNTKDGAFPILFPPKLDIQPIKLADKFESFENCHYLTESKDLVMIHTPGHTRGHTSVGLIANNNRLYLFGGDVAYSTNRLVNKAFSATIKNHQENIESCNQILSLAKTMKVVFLPTHDIDNTQNLEYNHEIKV